MKSQSAWLTLNETELASMQTLSKEYINFLSEYKIEREIVQAAIAYAQAAGYVNLDDYIRLGRRLQAGDKVYATTKHKAIILAHIGTAPLHEGFSILGAHIDSPRLDVKQNPLFEDHGIAKLDTHYYGGIKSYQWVTLPLALHGVVAKKDGTLVSVCIGEKPSDPVFCISDLLIHLAGEQMKKPASDVIDAEALDIIVGSSPLCIQRADDGTYRYCVRSSNATSAADTHATSMSATGQHATGTSTTNQQAADAHATDAPNSALNAASTPSAISSGTVKAALLQYLLESYGIQEDDFLSAELEVVPAGCAREMGFDRSMILAYGQDDSACAFTSLKSQLDVTNITRTALCVLVDKEEIGSVGASGMASCFFEDTVAELMECMGCGGMLNLKRALRASHMLSSDVSAGFDPAFPSSFEAKNTAFLGRGLVFNKYTGARGKSGSNDASAEYMARIRRIMDDAQVVYQTAELGKVNAGGGGTIAYLPAKYGMDVIDSGISVLSMHAPWEITSKVDVYEAYKGYKAFLEQRA